MDKLAIIGGRPLYGRLPISGAKNCALKVMVASLLTDEPLQLKNVPDLADIRQLRSLLEELGADVVCDTKLLDQPEQHGDDVFA